MLLRAKRRGCAVTMCKCVVCGLRPVEGVVMCSRCSSSFERSKRKDDGSIAAVIEWAATRARRLERWKWRKP
jgi:hypothetical protein